MPVTHAGRLTVSIAAGVGVALVGLTVVSLQNALQLSLGEERAFQVLRALALRGRLQKDAARVIQVCTTPPTGAPRGGASPR